MQYQGTCTLLIFVSTSRVHLKEYYSDLFAIHKTLLFLPCFSQANSIDIYWVKLFIGLLTCFLLNLAYLPNFSKPKSTSATFLWRKVTNSRNGSSSDLTQAKLIICQNLSIMVKGLLGIILVFLSGKRSAWYYSCIFIPAPVFNILVKILI